jgi:hypothetical protein
VGVVLGIDGLDLADPAQRPRNLATVLSWIFIYRAWKRLG